MLFTLLLQLQWESRDSRQCCLRCYPGELLGSMDAKSFRVQSFATVERNRANRTRDDLANIIAKDGNWAITQLVSQFLSPIGISISALFMLFA
jgi:hypothetical protein